MHIICSDPVLAQTLTYLQEAGRRSHECVVLWLGRRNDKSVLIEETYRPQHEAEADLFWISREGMDALKTILRERRFMVAAQVHSHPESAFHSAADDRWAIVRHQGALSLVLPHFGLRATPDSFMKDAKTYQLSASDEWVEVPTEERILRG